MDGMCDGFSTMCSAEASSTLASRCWRCSVCWRAGRALSRYRLRLLGLLPARSLASPDVLRSPSARLRHVLDWYDGNVGVLLILNAHFLKLLTEHGEGWRSTPPSWMDLLFWASLEALQFAWPYVAFQIARSVHPLGVAQTFGTYGPSTSTWDSPLYIES